MTIAVVLLTSDSSLGNYTLAGQSGVQFLQQLATQLSDQIIQTPKLGPELVRHFDTWLDACVQKVLMIPSDRPLLTADTLRALVEQNCQPVALLQDSEGEVAAACVDLSWLIDQFQTVGGQLSLVTMAQMVEQPALAPPDPAECLQVADLPTLAEAERIMRQRVNTRWMQAGVQMIDPATVYLHATVTLGSGTVILPNTHLWGQTTVGQACRIGPNTMVRDSEIGDGVVITASVVEEAIMEDQSDIGPFGHLRKGARVCRGAHMGNYGEIKNSVLGPNSKMGHFSYLGDAEIGENVNIGAGTITCNYDGVNKHKTIVRDGAFIGSDSMLVAPLEIGAGATIGAGSVVTKDVPAGAVAYGVPARVKESNEKGEERSGPGK